MLRIYHAKIDALPDSGDGLPLSSYRLKKLSACAHPGRRRQGLAAELLLIHALKETGIPLALPLRIDADSRGKPFFASLPLFFSLSHSGERAACALSDRPVGLDLEGERMPSEALLRRFFSPEEQNLVLRAEEPESVFAQLWTGKESYLKATGQGLSVELAKLEPLRAPEGVFFWRQRLERQQLCVCTLGCGDAPDCCEELSSREMTELLLSCASGLVSG